MRNTNENLFGEQLCLGGNPGGDIDTQPMYIALGAVVAVAAATGLITKYALKKSTPTASLAAVGVGAVAYVVAARSLTR